MNWDLAYDASAALSPVGPAGVVGGLALVLGIWVLHRSRIDRHTRRFGLVAGTALTLFGAGWLWWLVRPLAARHAALVQAVQSDAVVLHEGVVRDSLPGLEGRAARTHWRLVTAAGERRYRYASPPFEVGFLRRAPGEGVIRAGDRVRIGEFDGVIGRVELARPVAAPAPRPDP
jgi:hypothetical protein